MPSNVCPSQEELSVYILGKLRTDRSEEIDVHLQSCNDCQASLETLSAHSDTFLSGLHQREPAQYLNEPQCQQALARVRAIGCDPSLTARQQSARASEGDTYPRQIGPYRLLAELGRGGMGTVYKALHTKLDRVVALKVLPPDRMQSADAVARFEREMKAVGKLDHPNIVRASDADEEQGLHYLVMEYVDGIDLSALARRTGPLPIAEACDLIRQAANGLQHIHEYGLVHRDIKPSNLMLTSSSRHGNDDRAEGPALVKILDLGLALLADSADQRELTTSGQTMGTLDYMASEQCGDSHAVDIRADIYSLGATLYKLLTGEPIFAGAMYQKPLQRLRALAMESPPPIQSRRPDISDALAAVVARMIAREPRNRYAIPTDVAAVLAPFCGGANLAGLLARYRSAAPQRTDATITATLANLSAPEVDTDHSSAPPPVKTAPVQPKRPARIAALLACGGIAAALAALVIYFQSRHGTVQITINDPRIEVVMDSTGATIQGADKQHEISVKPGDHGLTISRGDFTFTTDKLTLNHNETIRLEIKLLHGTVQVLRDGNLIGQKPLASPNSASQVARVASVDRGTNPPRFTNSLGMEFAIIPKGRSWLGGGGGTPGDWEVEFQDDFYLGVCPVTQEEWERVMGSNPSLFSRAGARQEQVEDVPDADLKRFPVEGVSYADVEQFLARLNERDKQVDWQYRLPTGAEWEYACRGGPLRDRSESRFYFYIGEPSNELLPDRANYAHSGGPNRTVKVGLHAPNRLGLYDMHGNVLEWCSDSDQAPDGTKVRVARGSSWNDFAGRASSRNNFHPTVRYGSLGLRVIRVRRD